MRLYYRHMKLLYYRHWVSFWVFCVLLICLPITYWASLNGFGDSTDYFLQEVSSSVKGPDGRHYIYVGDDLRVTAYNYRHEVNGSCFIEVDRLRQNVGGKFAGRRHLMQRVEQRFVGDGKIRRTSWPIAPERITITEDWFDDPEAEEQEMDIFTTGTFYCNPLDWFWLKIGRPRVHHDQDENPEREHTRVVLRHHK